MSNVFVDGMRWRTITRADLMKWRARLTEDAPDPEKIAPEPYSGDAGDETDAG